jgi:hypothetical protein
VSDLIERLHRLAATSDMETGSAISETADLLTAEHARLTAENEALRAVLAEARELLLRVKYPPSHVRAALARIAALDVPAPPQPAPDMTRLREAVAAFPAKQEEPK